MRNRTRKGYRVRKSSTLFQIVLLLTLCISQLTFEILPVHAIHSSIYSNTQVDVAQSIPSTALAIRTPTWVKPTVRTIGDFLSLGANTAREAQEASRVAGGETRETLQQVTANLNALITTVSSTYQDNLNITINSLDDFTKRKINEITVTIERVNELLQEDIKLVSAESQAVIRTSSQEIQQVTKQLEESLKNIIIVGAESTAYVIDRTAYNAVIFLSLGMLGVGLLFFIWLLFTDQLPVGVARILVFTFGAIYISVFGSMGLFPPVRAYAMIYSGIGLKETLNNKPEGGYLSTAEQAKEQAWLQYLEACYGRHEILHEGWSPEFKETMEARFNKPFTEITQSEFESYFELTWRPTFEKSWAETGRRPRGCG